MTASIPLDSLFIPSANWELIDLLAAARRSVVAVSTDTVFVACHSSFIMPLLASFDVIAWPSDGGAGLFICLDSDVLPW